MTLTIVAGASRFELPVRPPRDTDAALGFGEAEGSEPLPAEQLEDGRGQTRLTHDPKTGSAELATDRTHGYRLPDGLEYRGRVENRFSIIDNDPLSSTMQSECEISIGRDAWRTHVIARARLTCDATTFIVQTDLSAWEDNEPVLTRDWSFTIPRDHV